jgi:hypothetical protein
MYTWRALFIVKDENTKKMNFSAVFELCRALKVFPIGFSPITRARGFEGLVPPIYGFRLEPVKIQAEIVQQCLE